MQLKTDSVSSPQLYLCIWSTLRCLLPAQVKSSKGSNLLREACSLGWKLAAVVTKVAMTGVLCRISPGMKEVRLGRGERGHDGGSASYA